MESLTGIPGLVGLYVGDSWNGDVWKDTSGNGNDATEVKGEIVVCSDRDELNGHAYLTGDINTSITFPKSILPDRYTLFHIARYNGISRHRIFDGQDDTNGGWLSGFWDGKSGIAYHQGWLTPHFYISIHDNDWVMSTDQNEIYRSNRVDRTLGKVGVDTSAHLGINAGAHISDEGASDWAVACVVVYNRNLNADEIDRVEAVLAQVFNTPMS